MVTGVLESLQREEAEDLIKRYGGKATKSISRNTSHVLLGEEAGPSKLAKVSKHTDDKRLTIKCSSGAIQLLLAIFTWG